MRKDTWTRSQRRRGWHVCNRMKSKFGFAPDWFRWGRKHDQELWCGVLGCSVEGGEAVRSVRLAKGVTALQAPDENLNAVGGKTMSGESVACSEGDSIVWIYCTPRESVEHGFGVLQTCAKSAQGEDTRPAWEAGVGHDLEEGGACLRADTVERFDAPFLSVCLGRGHGDPSYFRDGGTSGRAEHGEHFDRPLAARVGLVNQRSFEEPKRPLRGDHELVVEIIGFVGQPIQGCGNYIGADVAYRIRALGPGVMPGEISLKSARGREPLGKGFASVVGFRLRDGGNCCRDYGASCAPRRYEPGSALLHGAILRRSLSTLNPELSTFLR